MAELSGTDKAALSKVTNEYELAAHILTKASEINEKYSRKPDPSLPLEDRIKAMADNRQEIKQKIGDYLQELTNHKTKINDNIDTKIIYTLLDNDNLNKLTDMARKADKKSIQEIQQQGPTFKERIADLFKDIFPKWAERVQNERVAKAEMIATTGSVKSQKSMKEIENEKANKANKEYIVGAKERFNEVPKTIENHRKGPPVLDSAARNILGQLTNTQAKKVANLVDNCEVTQKAAKAFKESGVTPAKNTHVKKPVNPAPAKDVRPQGRGMN
jgi:hypothetical protein